MSRVMKEMCYRGYRCVMWLRYYQFLKIGIHSIIKAPNIVRHPDKIEIGDYVRIYSGLRIEAVKDEDDELKEAKIVIGDHVVIGQFAHIICKEQIVIEETVLMADRIYITDCDHNYFDVNKPIMYQGTRKLKKVRIGEGSWLGENVCILGASVGKHSVIGANSVVINDIPDYCIAVGAPARVVKRYNKETDTWEKVKGTK